ncbi:ATP-dependent RNA helicase Rhau isoform X2 [Choristoneura fumiferana]
MYQVKSNIEAIESLAAKENITLRRTESFIKKEKLEFTDDLDPKDFPEYALKRIKSEAIDSTEIQEDGPSTSKQQVEPVIFKIPKTDPPETPDFIPIGPDTPELMESLSTRQLSLSGKGDYKYSYKDILTGTFEDKLNENIANGVIIAAKTEENDNLSFALHEEYKEMVQRDGYKTMMRFREKLPTFKKAAELLNVISNNQVVVISGETGCGKSTQVPQIILDDAICNNKGAYVHILVTQPRRIAASSLAARVAQERAEHLGNSVGYAVRLEKTDCRARGSIMYCTTGILLADLEVNQGLVNFSHIILDEAHERDCHMDFSMCMVKQVLKKRKDLKLILMSATIDSERLSAYFDDCPVIHIEGLAYPVQALYLEDVLNVTNYRLPEDTPRPNRGTKRFQERMNKMKMSKKIEKDVQHRAEIAPWLESVKKNLSRDVYMTLQDSRIEELNIDLILALLLHICKSPPGAILVFLPGMGDITKLISAMEKSAMFPRQHFEIYPLHSKLPTLDQRRIFDRPPPHIRKIIVATNIAETSITIDDIVYVIDCGRIKITGLNVEDNIQTLQNEFVSKANLMQRRGRAGRCQPGIAYHLLTSYRAQVIPDRHLPELQRSNLLEPVLTIKKLRLGKALTALQLVPDAPAETTIQKAVTHLQQCGALDDEEKLTPLGWHLARLPVHPAAGKLLLFGALFGCVDRAASVAAVWGFKDPFNIVIGKERQVEEAKRLLAQGEPSDHVAISEAIIQWERIGPSQQNQFAYDYFLSNSTLRLLSEMKQQLCDTLTQMGFLTSRNTHSAWENRNADNLCVFKAIVAASLYPNIANVKWIMPRRRNKPTRITIRTPDEGKVTIHPSSVMYSKPGGEAPLCNNPGANWLVYWLKQRSTQLFLFEVTLVYTLPLMFFGELAVSEIDDVPEDCLVSVSTVKVQCKKETAELVFKLRSLLDQVLASMVMESSSKPKGHSQFDELVLKAVTNLISAEDERLEVMNEDSDDSDRNDDGGRTGHHNRPRFY